MVCIALERHANGHMCEARRWLIAAWAARRGCSLRNSEMDPGESTGQVLARGFRFPPATGALITVAAGLLRPWALMLSLLSSPLSLAQPAVPGWHVNPCSLNEVDEAQEQPLGETFPDEVLVLSGVENVSPCVADCLARHPIGVE